MKLNKRSNIVPLDPENRVENESKNVQKQKIPKNKLTEIYLHSLKDIDDLLNEKL